MAQLARLQDFKQSWNFQVGPSVAIFPPNDPVAWLYWALFIANVNILLTSQQDKEIIENNLISNKEQENENKKEQAGAELSQANWVILTSN